MIRIGQIGAEPCRSEAPRRNEATQQVGTREARAAIDQPDRPCHSHSIVPGGFDVTSYATRFTPGTSLMMRLDRRSRRS